MRLTLIDIVFKKIWCCSFIKNTILTIVRLWHVYVSRRCLNVDLRFTHFHTVLLWRRYKIIDIIITPNRRPTYCLLFPSDRVRNKVLNHLNIKKHQTKCYHCLKRAFWLLIKLKRSSHIIIGLPYLFCHGHRKPL